MQSSKITQQIWSHRQTDFESKTCPDENDDIISSGVEQPGPDPSSNVLEIQTDVKKQNEPQTNTAQPTLQPRLDLLQTTSFDGVPDSDNSESKVEFHTTDDFTDYCSSNQDIKLESTKWKLLTQKKSIEVCDNF